MATKHLNSRRYTTRDDGDGQTTIMDIFTALPAEVHGRILPRVRTGDADQMALTLNLLDRWLLQHH